MNYGEQSVKRVQTALLSTVTTTTTLSVAFFTAGALCPPQAQAEQVLNGQVAVCHIDRLTRDIHWYDSLDQAKEAAQAQGKMIFWVHMLGNISGAT